MQDIYIDEKLSRFVVKDKRNQLGLIEVLDISQQGRVVKCCKTTTSASTWITKQQMVIDKVAEECNLSEEDRQNMSFQELQNEVRYAEGNL